MKTNAICVVNGATIQVGSDERQLVPIKPICDALGLAYRSQVNKVKEHPIFGSVVSLWDTTGADGKTYQMLCLPMEFVFGWIFSINPNNVSESYRDTMIRYQRECNHALFEYFTMGMRKERELLEAENKCLKDLDEARSQLAEYKDGVTQVKKRISDIEQSLISIRNERHNPHPALF